MHPHPEHACIRYNHDKKYRNLHVMVLPILDIKPFGNERIVIQPLESPFSSSQGSSLNNQSVNGTRSETGTWENPDFDRVSGALFPHSIQLPKRGENGK